MTQLALVSDPTPRLPEGIDLILGDASEAIARAQSAAEELAATERRIAEAKAKARAALGD